MKKLKIAVLGHLGSIGSRHYKNLAQLGHLVRGYDPYGFDNSREEVIEWADAVVIASPTSEHYKDILTCQAADKPMFVEKPLINTMNEFCNILLHDILLVGYNLRFHSCVIKAREILGEGRIGQPIWARFTCAQKNDRPEYQRDGVILNWSHEVDLAFHLLGEGHVYAAAGLSKPENMVDIVIRHTINKCQTVIHLDYLTTPERRGFVIVGTHGAVECDLVSRQLFVRRSDGKIGEMFYGDDTFDGNYIHEMIRFTSLVNGDKHEIGATAYEAYLVCDACLRAKNIINGRAA